MTTPDDLAPRASRVRGHRRNCRCAGCAALGLQYQKRRKLAVHRGTWQPLTDATPWLELLHDCRAGGWTPPQIGAVTGLDYRLVRILLGDDPGISAPERLRSATVTALKRLAGANRYGLAVPDSTWVDAVGTRRRVQALAMKGWSQRNLAARTDARISSINSARLIEASTARAILTLFVELADIDGPSSSARIRASSKGWVPPAAWEGLDIDDPRTVPDVGAVTDPVSASVEDAEWLVTEHGLSWEAAAAQVGVRKDTLHTYRKRVRDRAAAGRPS